MVPKWLGLSTSAYTRAYEVLVLGAVSSVTYAVDLTSVVDVQIKNSGNPFPDANLKVNSIWTGGDCYKGYQGKLLFLCLASYK